MSLRILNRSVDLATRQRRRCSISASKNNPCASHLLAAVLLSLLVVGPASCGGGSSRSQSSASTTRATAGSNPDAAATGAQTSTTALSNQASELRRKGQDFKDGDSDSNFDDGTVLYYGHEASPKQEQAITSLVRRYFQAMSSDNGAAACPLLFSLFAEVIVEDYGSPTTGQKSLRGTTCPVIVTKFFKQYGHRGTPLLVGVRLEGKKGLALLQFHPGAAPRSIELHEEFGTWKLKALLDASLP